MNLIIQSLKFGLLLNLFFFGNSGTSSASPIEPSAGQSCMAPEYRQFDFWAGDWDVFETEKPLPVAHVVVDRILDGCVLREDYQDETGHKGQSFTIYDASRKVWHQSWVTNRGELLTIEGQLRDGEMVLSGADRTTGGKESLVHGVWKPVGNAVRESAERSTDGGKTWNQWFDLIFRPAAKRHAISMTDEEKNIAALDTEYQEAVKKNDASAMDRLLADNFVLVTGAGKIYKKTDLLEEARSGRLVYERQEDSEQKVRIWGDTAVITAKLWAKGVDHGKIFEYTLWFSDTYARTQNGWRYVFGQASLPLPKSATSSSSR